MHISSQPLRRPYIRDPRYPPPNSHSTARRQLGSLRALCACCPQGLEFFNDQLTKLCISWLSDSVHSVRDSAATNLKNLTAVFGVDWASTVVLPEVHAVEGSAVLCCAVLCCVALRCGVMYSVLGLCCSRSG